MAVSQAIDNKSGVNEWPAGNGGGEPKALRRQVCRSWGQTELEEEGGGEVKRQLVELGRCGEKLWKKYRRGKCFIKGRVEMMSSGLGIPFS